MKVRRVKVTLLVVLLSRLTLRLRKTLVRPEQMPSMFIILLLTVTGIRVEVRKGLFVTVLGRRLVGLVRVLP